jgi:predicted DNA-binding protein
MKKQVAFTLRFDPDLYERAKKVSRRKGRSLTAFIQEAVSKKLAEEEAASLYQAFTLVGQDMQESSVDYAHGAQQETVLKDE